MNVFSCFAGMFRFKRYKLWRLYEQGSDRIEKEFDLVKILTTLRNLKILSKKQLSPETLLEMKTHSKNAIDLDSPR